MKNYDKHFYKVSGPLGVNRQCKYCRFNVFLSTGIEGVGRGYGMRYGNRARGEMIQHLKATHLEEMI